MRTRNMIIAALCVALSYVGSNVKILGTIAFDSLPAFLSSLLLGPIYGAAIGFLGHLFTALTSGFPLSLPIHFVIAISMAVTMAGFGVTHRALKNKAPAAVLFAVTGAVGIILNGPVSAAFAYAALALTAGRGAAAAIAAMLPALMAASAVNVVIAIALFKALEKVWGKSYAGVDKA
ncbi:MAG: ECF transporter S component [Clostridiales bacterium]|nr:ECF transporter S component [Clostridiales bacterium]